MKTTLQKKWATFTVVCLMMIGLVGCPCGPGSIAFVPDDALESAMRAALNQPLGCLSLDDLSTITEIQAAGLNITNLEGLEHCTSLQILNLTSNNIFSITPLENLTSLIFLELGDNNITNIEPISGLVLLEYLDLFGEGNEILDWGPLESNALAGSGLGAGDLVVLPTGTTLDEDNNVLPYWKPIYDNLVGTGLTIVFAEPDGNQI